METDMSYSFSTERFEFEYKEDKIESELLWESHCHARFEMISVLEGDISITLEGREYRLTESQTAILPPLVYHTVTANKKGRYSRVTAQFDATSIPKALRERFAAREREAFIFYSNEQNELSVICRSGQYDFYAPLSEAIITKMLYECTRVESSYESAVLNDALQRALDHIDAHLCEKITLDDLAAATARSKSSICHLFAEKMRVTPKQYILQKKLALARKLIDGGTPPTAAAVRIGYDNYSDFYRIYKKHTGHSPSKE